MFPGSALFRYYSRVSSPSSAGASSSHGKRTSEDGGTSSRSTMPIARSESSSLASTERTPPLLSKDNLHSVCNQPHKRKLPRSNPAVKLCKPRRDNYTTPAAAGVEIDRESVGNGNVVILTDSEAPGPIVLSDSTTSGPIVLSDSATEIALGGVVPKKKKKSYEATRKFQDTWAARLPWATLYRGPDGLYDFVKCNICSTIESREKILAPKWDTLKKHGGKRKAEKNMPRGILCGQWYIAVNCKHLRNERRWAARGAAIPVRDQLLELKGERARKRLQMGTIFHLLEQGRPMLEYEALQPLFEFLEVPKIPKRHWSDNAGWTMAEAMYAQVLNKTRTTVSAARYIALSCDEVSSIDNSSWISVHAYVVQNWSRVPVLISLEHVADGGKAKNLTKMIMSAVGSAGGLSQEDIGNRLLCFGADGVSTFQGCRTGVIRRIQDDWSPRLQGIHCMAHRGNLAVETLSELPVVIKIENMLAALYNFFTHSPKRHVEFVKLAEVMETKGLKILQNVKTRWISMLAPAVRVMNEYRTLLVKMQQDEKEPAAANCLNYLTDVQIVVALSCLLPMLRAVHSLMQFAQKVDAFVCDMLAAVKICQADLNSMYIDSETAFTQPQFWDFNALLTEKHDAIPMKWVSNELDLNSEGVEYLSFEPTGHSIRAVHREGQRLVGILVTKDVFAAIISAVKSQTRAAAARLIKELADRFPAAPLMDALGMIYPQYWLDADCEANFKRHLVVVKEHYGYSKKFSKKTKVVSEVVREVDPVLSPATLDMQASLFVVTMAANAKACMQKPIDINPVTRCWRTIDNNAMLRHGLSEYLKVAEMAIAMVLGSVQDERTFSTVSFMKSRLRNRLTTHLELVVGMKAQSFYTLFNFPYDEAYQTWKSEKRACDNA